MPNPEKEKILNNLVRDICSISVAAADKSKVRDIVSSALDRLEYRIYIHAYEEGFESGFKKGEKRTLGVMQKFVGEHNARILNEYQLNGLGDERILFAPIEKAMKEKFSLLPSKDEASKDKVVFTCPCPDLKDHCNGCTSRYSEGTHQGCTVEHGHAGCHLASKETKE